jgi:hypothetical protein
MAGKLLYSLKHGEEFVAFAVARLILACLAPSASLTILSAWALAAGIFEFGIRGPG